MGVGVRGGGTSLIFTRMDGPMAHKSGSWLESRASDDPFLAVYKQFSHPPAWHMPGACTQWAGGISILLPTPSPGLQNKFE